MSEFNGTKGPWVVDGNGVNARWNIDAVSGEAVAITNQLANDKDWAVRDANTLLISASPDLLAALQQLVEIYDCNDGRVRTTSSKRRALRYASGSGHSSPCQQHDSTKETDQRRTGNILRCASSVV